MQRHSNELNINEALLYQVLNRTFFLYDKESFSSLLNALTRGDYQYVSIINTNPTDNLAYFNADMRDKYPRLLNYLKSNSEFKTGGGALLLYTMLHCGSELLPECLVKALCTSTGKQEPDAESLITALTNLYGELASLYTPAIRDMKRACQMLFAVSAEAARQTRAQNPRRYNIMLEGMDNYLASGFDLSCFYTKVIQLSINPELLKKVISKGLEIYRANPDLQSFSLFSNGKLKPENQLLQLLDGIDIDHDPLAEVKMIAMLQAYFYLASTNTHECFVDGVFSLKPLESETFNLYRQLINEIFGKSATHAANYDYDSPIFNAQKRDIKKFIPWLIAKQYYQLVAAEPKVKDLHNQYVKLFEGKITVEQLRNFIMQPDIKNYMKLLPADLRKHYLQQYMDLKPKP